MGNIYAKIPDDDDKKFRDAVYAKFGFKKGSLEKGIQEAITEWTKKNKSKKENDD